MPVPRNRGDLANVRRGGFEDVSLDAGSRRTDRVLVARGAVDRATGEQKGYSLVNVGACDGKRFGPFVHGDDEGKDARMGWLQL